MSALEILSLALVFWAGYCAVCLHAAQIELSKIRKVLEEMVNQ